MILNGNVFLKGAKRCWCEAEPAIHLDFDPDIRLVDSPTGPSAGDLARQGVVRGTNCATP